MNLDVPLVALDLETTGLDPERDTIIEVGAVRFRVDGTIMEEYQTLVNPGRALASRIAQLTGIDNDMLLTAPEWYRVQNDVAEFIGDSPVVGHNVVFDVNFLRSHGVYPRGPLLDTFDLATIILPGLRRYNLGFLAQSLDIPLEDAHRALHDARATARIFVSLLQRGILLPRPVLQAILRLMEGRTWRYAPLFRYMWEEHQRLGMRRKEDILELRPRLTAEHPFSPPMTASPLHPQDTYTALDVENLAAILEEEGALSRIFPQYEHRPQQVHMMREVARALNEGRHLLIEAGTGTGKSLAYLLPAVTFAHLNQEHVVIATHTINLQDQLLQKDLPLLQQIVPFAFYATTLKGRSNYLCVRRLQEFIQRPDLEGQEITFAAKLLVWLSKTSTGDKSELGLNREEESRLWQEVASDANTCSRERCQEAGDFYFIARDRAERSHLIIVNHALLLADIGVEHRAIPSYEHLIVDEAHHLEDAVTQQLGYTVTQHGFQNLLYSIYTPHIPQARHLFQRVQSQLTPLILGVETMTELSSMLNDVGEEVRRLLPHLERFWRDVLRFVNEHQRERPQGGYTQRLRITPGDRAQPLWSHVDISWDRVDEHVRRILQGLERLSGRLELHAHGPGREHFADLAVDIRAVANRLSEAAQHIRRFVSQPADDYIYWVEYEKNGERLALRAAPLHVGELVARHLWNVKRSVIMTSATLRTGGSFDYLRDRLSAWEADELSLGSPYDYASSTLLYLPTDIPEPNRRGYQDAVERSLVDLALATGGRMLVLFTSYNQLRRTSEAIGPELRKAGIAVYEQGMGGRTQLLESFRTTGRAVLLGTRSFWEGIDVPGDALSVLVITRLPFAVPSDPIVQARAETYENPFHEYQVPQAILQFRQGFGRLIRSRTDRGVVVILDRRIQSKTYGKLFLDALPPCTVQRAPLAHLPEAARHWLENLPPAYKRRVE